MWAKGSLECLRWRLEAVRQECTDRSQRLGGWRRVRHASLPACQCGPSPLGSMASSGSTRQRSTTTHGTNESRVGLPRSAQSAARCAYAPPPPPGLRGWKRCPKHRLRARGAQRKAGYREFCRRYLVGARTTRPPNAYAHRDKDARHRRRYRFICMHRIAAERHSHPRACKTLSVSPSRCATTRSRPDRHSSGASAEGSNPARTLGCRAANRTRTPPIPMFPGSRSGPLL